jgi:periplasmic divalent cation tolerance protein
MKDKEPIQIVLVTAPDKKTARKLAQAALKARLAACVHLMPKGESHYWWDGKLEVSKETQMVIKTTSEALPKLEALISSKHPYDCPEFLVLSASAASPAYARWVQETCAHPASKKK